MKVQKRFTLMPALLLAALIVWAGAPALATNVSTSPMVDIANETGGTPPIGGGAASTIIREPGGVTINVHTTIEPGAYTVWLLIWNDPSQCTNAGPPACLPPPAGGSDVPDSVMFGSGQVVPSSGRGDFAVRVDVGDTNKPIIGGALRTGLTNAMGAEIHVLLRTHGDVIPELLEAQITTVGGACDVNGCDDLQGAVHSPLDPTPEIVRLDALKSLVDRIAIRNGLRPE